MATRAGYGRFSIRAIFQPLAFIILFLTGSSALANNAPLRVGFLCPKPPEQAFWSQVIQVMRAAAKDLNIELIVRCDDTYSLNGTKHTGTKLLETEPRLDYFLTGYWRSVTRFHLELARQRGIKVFIFNADIKDEERQVIGYPRGDYKNWIGHMIPDDKAAARELIRILISQHRKFNKPDKTEKMEIFGIMGAGNSSIAINRNAGLRQEVADTPGAVLHEKLMDYWRIEAVRNGTIKILNTNDNIDIIWCNNNASTWGALQGVESVGKIPGKDIFIGGFDWNKNSIQAIADGKITASMFGHFMQGAWALLLVHDYHFGLDFIDQYGPVIYTPLNPITAENYAKYKIILEDAHWDKVDFRKHSKKYNPDLLQYDFTINQFLDLNR